MLLRSVSSPVSARDDAVYAAHVDCSPMIAQFIKVGGEGFLIPVSWLAASVSSLRESDKCT